MFCTHTLFNLIVATKKAYLKVTDESLSQLFAYILHVQEGKHNNNQTLLHCGITRKGIEAVVEKAEGSCWLVF